MCIGSVDYAKLSDEELVALINDGNNAHLQELLRRYEGMLRSKAVNFSTSIDFEDYVQEGRIALFSATKVYNSSLSSFSTFASICVSRAMCSLKEKHNAKKQQPNNNAISINEDENDLIFENNTPESTFIEKEECRLLAENIKSALSAFEYKILLSFLSGESIEAISNRFEVTVKVVNNALFRARAKIKTLH